MFSNTAANVASSAKKIVHNRKAVVNSTKTALLVGTLVLVYKFDGTRKQDKNADTQN